MRTNIKELRIQKGITQKQLADMLNIKQTTVSEWENCRSYPRIEIAIQLSKIFNVEIDYIVGIKDNSGITYPQRFIEVSDTEKQLIAEFRKSRHNAQKFLIDLDEQEENKK